jgi:hypothetical protein
LSQGLGLRGVGSIIRNSTLLASCYLTVLAFTSSAQADLLFVERFPGPGLPAGWSFDTDGTWAVVSAELDQSRIGQPGHADAWAGDLSWTDYSVEAQFKFLEFGSTNMEAGLGLRHDQLSTGGNFFVTRVSWRDSFWDLEVVKTLAPEIHIPLNQSLTTDTWYTMKSQIEGDNLKVWVNDILYDFGNISSSLFPIPSAGGIGVWTNNAHVRFDDVVVTRHGSGPRTDFGDPLRAGNDRNCRIRLET